jgi:hypothetical protein
MRFINVRDNFVTIPIPSDMKDLKVKCEWEWGQVVYWKGNMEPKTFIGIVINSQGMKYRLSDSEGEVGDFYLEEIEDQKPIP